MAKKVSGAGAMPPECCGVCKFSAMDGRDLVCYGMPPSVLLDENGEPYLIRGAIIEPADPICHLFIPRMHS